jgi:hypothetical protein
MFLKVIQVSQLKLFSLSPFIRLRFCNHCKLSWALCQTMVNSPLTQNNLDSLWLKFWHSTILPKSYSCQHYLLSFQIHKPIWDFNFHTAQLFEIKSLHNKLKFWSFIYWNNTSEATRSDSGQYNWAPLKDWQKLYLNTIFYQDEINLSLPMRGGSSVFSSSSFSQTFLNHIWFCFPSYANLRWYPILDWK